MDSMLENISINLTIGSFSFKIFLENSFWNKDIGIDCERHNHSTYEVHLITEGSGFLHLEMDELPLSSGILYITKPGIFHYQEQDPENPIKKYCFKFDFWINKDKEDILNNSEIEIINKYLSKNLVVLHDLLTIESIVNAMHSEIQNNFAFFYVRIQQLFGQLLIEIFRKIADENNSVFKSSTKIFHEERVSIIENFFDHCPDFNSSPYALCQKIYVSPSQLNRILKKLYDKSFKQKMTEVRVEYIKYHLQNSNISIKNISEKTGYSTEGNFSIAFKRITGLSPTEYRDRYSRRKV